MEESEKKLTIKALAAIRGQTIPQLASDAGITHRRLYRISNGGAKMHADELLALAKTCEVSPYAIEFEYKKAC